MICAVLFDADGVVQRQAADWRNRVAELCGDPRQAEVFLEEVFAMERPCLTGTCDFGRVLDDVLRRWESPFTVHDALRVWTLIEPDPDILEVAARLRSNGVTVALATNQQSYRADFMTFRLGYAETFDYLFYSCDIGYAKPSDEYFQSVLERLGLPAEAVLFLDDHEANVMAASRLGLSAEVFSIEQGAAGAKRLLEQYDLPCR